MRDGAGVLAARPVSRETLVRLEAYVALLRKWNPTINLVSRATLDAVWSRHILDSVQLLDLVPNRGGHWADLGSGAGLPGLVIAAVAVEERPGLHVTLVEPDGRKAAFLAAAARELALKLRIERARAEDLPSLNADVVSARALAPLPTLLGFAARHLAPSGTAIFPKGATADAELAAALELWRFSLQKHASMTDPAATILTIKDIRHV